MTPTNEYLNAPQTSDTFYVGLCMAGAVSAGAYTAGVMDYLIEALDTWEQKKQSHDPDVPTHKVEIPVMGGASAGGMTAVMTAAAIQEPLLPVRSLSEAKNGRAKQNKLYNSWVNLTAEDMLLEMLDTSDIDKNHVRSLLNSKFIEDIANDVIKTEIPEPLSRPYFSENLKVFLTLSNLGGMKYSVAFKSRSPEINRHVISSHNDYACFQVPYGPDKTTEPGWIPMDFKDQQSRELAINAAMATGAFPAGLRARNVKRSCAHMLTNDWFARISNNNTLHPFQEELYDELFVDGGLINNEPFEKVRTILDKVSGQTESNDYQSFSRTRSTVLMIDPFPSELEQIRHIKSDHLFSVVSATLGAMIGQIRVKPEHLIEALASDLAGQYLVSPTRYLPDGTAVEGKKALACGALSGFAGFVSKEFRIHDFFLGRANCEQFLRHHFTIPKNAGNPIIDQGYKNVQSKDKFTSGADQGWQIIPLFSDGKNKPYMPIFNNATMWPSVRERDIEKYRKPISNRVNQVLMNLTSLDRRDRMLLWAGSYVFLRRKLSTSILSTITEDLNEWGQLERR